jgi:hypothetical protein
MRKLITAATLVILTLTSCKAIQGVKCESIKQIPVTTIGINGTLHTVYVPYCDTLRIIPKQAGM